MNDALGEVVDLIGRASMGGLWEVVGRGKVAAWMRENPATVEEAKRRLRAAVQEGRL